MPVPMLGRWVVENRKLCALPSRSADTQTALVHAVPLLIQVSPEKGQQTLRPAFRLRGDVRRALWRCGSGEVLKNQEEFLGRERGGPRRASSTHTQVRSSVRICSAATFVACGPG